MKGMEQGAQAEMLDLALNTCQVRTDLEGRTHLHPVLGNHDCDHIYGFRSFVASFLWSLRKVSQRYLGIQFLLLSLELCYLCL